ncbi:hypothetical protein [Streptomyces natalensis]|uniref:hypothetical protein n=1 Tax=Streptomyces natalensis TaxID=68242 RepID=UPI00069139EC|nr:hypothetical protein [Streptomyces natalensis]
MTTGTHEPEETGEETGSEERRSGNSPVEQRSSGGISVGVLTGGAVAAGPGASAEDRSRRFGRSAPVPAPPGGEAGAVPPPAAPDGGIGIGVMTGGAVAAGAEARALDNSTQALDASPELRTAMRTLREQLCLLSPSEETAEVEAGLAEAEEEIAATGQVRRDRLQWLRERLDLGTSAVAGLASAVAVVQQITQLLGGQG